MAKKQTTSGQSQRYSISEKKISQINEGFRMVYERDTEEIKRMMSTYVRYRIK